MNDRNSIETLSADELVELLTELDLLKDRAEAALMAIRGGKTEAAGWLVNLEENVKPSQRIGHIHDHGYCKGQVSTPTQPARNDQ